MKQSHSNDGPGDDRLSLIQRAELKRRNEELKAFLHRRACRAKRLAVHRQMQYKLYDQYKSHSA